MCCGYLCSCLYNCKSCFVRLLLPLLIIDLCLTGYIVVQLCVNIPFACCTDPTINDCSYDDIGGADNVGVLETGFCYRKDNVTLDCETSISSCASSQSIDMESDLCSEDVLDELALDNWSIFLGILSVKAVGLIFLIYYDITHTWCTKSGKDAADEDAEHTKKCCACNCTKEWCKSLIFFVLRILFLIFGTVTTFVAILLLKWTDSVSFSTCKLLDGSLSKDCYTIEDECSIDAENYYAIVWQNLYLAGPYYIDLVANVLSGIIWAVRISVVWYYGRHLAKV